VLAFIRERGDEKLICVFNFAGDPADWTLPSELGGVEVTALAVDAAGALTGVLEEDRLALPPLGCFLGRIG